MERKEEEIEGKKKKTRKKKLEEAKSSCSGLSLVRNP